MEIVLVMAMVIVAAVGIFAFFRRSLIDSKNACSCGQGRPCADPGCSGHVVFNNRGRPDTTSGQTK